MGGGGRASGYLKLFSSFSVHVAWILKPPDGKCDVLHDTYCCQPLSMFSFVPCHFWRVSLSLDSANTKVGVSRGPGRYPVGQQSTPNMFLDPCIRAFSVHFLDSLECGVLERRCYCSVAMTKSLDALIKRKELCSSQLWRLTVQDQMQSKGLTVTSQHGAMTS